MNIKELKKELGIKDDHIASFFEILDNEGNPDTNKFRNSKGGKTNREKGLINFYSFLKEKYTIKKKSNISKYADWLNADNTDGRPRTPSELGVKSLWIPERSSNRTACIDLNHGKVHKHDILQDCYVGYNGNCNTKYIIVEVPVTWTKTDLYNFADEFCEKFGIFSKEPIRELHSKTINRTQLVVNSLNGIIPFQ